MSFETWLAFFVASWLISLSPHEVRALNRALGGIFVAAGVFLATFRRAA